MKLFSWVFAKPRKRILRWRGTGDFDFEIVGESKYQDVLSEICGGKCEDGHEYECEAFLVPEPANKFDKNAIAVYIDGDKVGYLSRDDAATYQGHLRRLRLQSKEVACEAIIVGGWDRGGKDVGSFGVKLDFQWPPTLVS